MHMHRRLLLVVTTAFLLILAGCAVGVSGTPAPPTPTLTAHEVKIRQVQTGVKFVRKLDVKQNLRPEFLTKDQLRDYLTRSYPRFYSREQARLDVLELWLLR